MIELQKLNFEKLVGLVAGQGLVLPEKIECFLADDVIEGHVIASVGSHRYKIRNDGWELFVNTVANGTVADFEGMLNTETTPVWYEVIMEDHRDQKCIPVFGVQMEEIPNDLQELILERANGMMSICANKIGRIAHLMNAAQDRVLRDGDIIKDFDALVTFNTELGHGFNPVLCIDRVPPILDSIDSIEINRSPFSEEDIELFISKEHQQITRHLNELTDVVQAFLNSKAVRSSTLTEELGINVVNATIVNPMLEQMIRFISFGGIDNWRLGGDLTPNSTRCHEMLDQAIREILELMDFIPKPEGVDYWAIDVKTLNIVGRDNENRNVGEPLIEESAAITMRYNEGFQELLKLRLRMSDNKIIVSA